jgi:hypothetical protein
MSARRGQCLIMSGAYIGAEMVAEFGLLPPAFLPVGNARLYEYQIPRLGALGPIHLTVPEHFHMPAEDARRLAELGVELLPVPEDLRLGEAVVYAINSLGISDGAVYILHGDTLLDENPPERSDIIAVATQMDAYSWAQVSMVEDRVGGLETLPGGGTTGLNLLVAAGYFSFSSSASLVRAITRARGDFVRGIDRYAQDTIVAAWPVTNWLDFGHVQTFYRSRRSITTARSFNALSNDGLAVRKTSEDQAKIAAEAYWLAELPPNLRIYSARLLDSGEIGGKVYYDTEYEYIPTLSELFVFGAIGQPVWRRIFGACAEFLTATAAIKGGCTVNQALGQLTLDKTMTRLEAHARASGFDIDVPNRLAGRTLPSLRAIADDLAGLIRVPDDKAGSVMHGDFCFSNILFNFRIRRIKVIDPRGYVEAGKPSLFGDFRYDLAKLAHSVIGRYDQIIAGRYTLQARGNNFDIDFEPIQQQGWLEEELTDLTIEGVPAAGGAVRAIMTGLFLSMLPLHADRPDRQRAFIANALRLYADLDKVRA